MTTLRIEQDKIVRIFSEGLLDALTDTYREANGLLPTTPPRGSDRGSPAPEER